MRLRIIGGAGLALAVTLVASGCSTAESGSRRDVVVSAAASLTDVFTSMENAFEQDHPESEVILNLGGSAALREQILEGAPADVFASANLETMNDVVDGGEVAGFVQVFATNHMVIAVPAGNPAGIVGLEDLGRKELFVGLCAESVPCGVFARKVLMSAGVEPSIDTNESDVRSLLLKIGLGEIDVGIVYVTDVISAAGVVDSIAVPSEHDVTAEYPIALMAAAPNSGGGEAFVQFVISDKGAAVLEQHGFGTP
jgi:molybdate transport system substrate-binding protein